MPSSSDRRGARWLRGELPSLISSGAISQENARSIEEHYARQESASRGFGFVLLATIGAALVAAGIVLLIAHNWDEFSRPLRSVIAFLPLISAQALSAFVLLRRDQSKPWRECAAIFNVAGIGTAIALVSQTYQIHGSLADFIVVWLVLSIPLVYLMRTTMGAVAFLIGCAWWFFNQEIWGRATNPFLGWVLLALVVPYFASVYRRDPGSRETAGLAIGIAIVAGIALGFTAGFTKSNLGVLAFAGLFTAVYISGIEFFPLYRSGRLHPLTLLGGLAIGVMTIVLTFEELWRHQVGFSWPSDVAQIIGVAIELCFPLAAIALAGWSLLRRRAHFSVLAAAFPIFVGVGWLLANGYGSTGWTLAVTILLDVYALGLGVELIARGMKANSVARANFGLGVIAALAIARFFDSDLSFVARAIGFIVIGLGFLLTNFLLFKKRRLA
jgi:hypothetical protein